MIWIYKFRTASQNFVGIGSFSIIELFINQEKKQKTQKQLEQHQFEEILKMSELIYVLKCVNDTLILVRFDKEFKSIK